MPGFIISFVISLVLSVASYYISARRMKSAQNTTKPQTIQQPTVDMGRAMPVAFGRVRIKSPNLLWMGAQNSTAIKK